MRGELAVSTYGRRSAGRNEPDVRHPEMIAKELRLQGEKTRSTSVLDKKHECEELLDHEWCKEYQFLCARATLLVIDRIHLQSGAKECCRSMTRPTVEDWFKLKRMDRVLAGCPNLLCEYKSQDEQE